VTDLSATNDQTTGLVDVLTSDDGFGDIDFVERAQSGETGGSVVDPDGSVPTADDSAGTGAYDPTTTGTNDFGDVLDAARNLGPDWLDEVTVVAVVLLVIGALLWLARPILSIIAGVAD